VNGIPYNISKEQKESYINEYKELTKEYKELNKAIKYAVKNNLDYKDLKDRKNVIKKRIKELETIFYFKNISFR
jgi:CHASE3 domain sensor protein